MVHLIKIDNGKLYIFLDIFAAVKELVISLWYTKSFFSLYFIVFIQVQSKRANFNFAIASATNQV